jgi:lysine-specific demethylase/histidyl-hydroxylase NO66
VTEAATAPSAAAFPPETGGTALRRCVGDVQAFLSVSWGRRVHRHGGQDYTDLLSLEHVDQLVSGSALRLPAFRLVRRGETLDSRSYTRHGRVGSRPIADLLDPGRVYRLFEEGATIVLQGLHRYWEPVTRFCRDLELSLTHPVQANAYVTPPVSSGLNVHADGHDVFALQTYGTKQWVTWAPGGPPHAPPEHDLELRPGECLYVPRGTRHAARTVATASIHLTIGIRALTWREVLRSELERALREALDEPHLDEALPVGFAADPDMLEQLVATRLAGIVDQIAKVNVGEAARAACRRFWSARPPLLAGQLEQLLGLDRIDDHSRVRRRPGTICRLEREGDVLSVLLGDRELRMPASVEPALRVIADRDTFLVADLAEYLDDDARIVLVRRLVREGLLMIDGSLPGSGASPARHLGA